MSGAMLYSSEYTDSQQTSPMVNEQYDYRCFLCHTITQLRAETQPVLCMEMYQVIGHCMRTFTALQ